MRNIGSSTHYSQLAILIVPGILYVLLVQIHLPLTGIHQWDGILGVLLGLYTCSIPVANALDKILYGKYQRGRFASPRAEGIWWSFNALVVLVGLLSIVMGLLRFNLLR